MRLTLTTVRGGTVWDEEPPAGTEAIFARHIPACKPMAIYQNEAANRIAGAILRDLLPLPPSPKLFVLMTNLQTIEHRENSRIVILR
ncbi:MAG TPA: hypothetical protein VFU78_19760 [Thermomicrobiales bacterium]|nr:hypothetical protein [Thermomicrobiales bacterium]